MLSALLSDTQATFEYNGYAYQVGKLLGRGSFGRVYAVLGNPQFVIKVVPVKTDKHKAMIQREIMFTQTVLNHPFIIRCFAHNYTNSAYHILYERILGNALSQYLTIYGDSDTSLAFKLHTASQLLCAVAHLHAHTVIHRDIKPHNIMIQTHPFHVKLIDFGLSRYQHENRGISGTKVYNAPELFLDQPQTAGVDLWSTGCCLFTLFFNANIFVASQTKPFANASPSSIPSIYNRLMQFLDAQTVTGPYSAILAIIRQLLAFEPSQRIPASEAMLALRSVYTQVACVDLDKKWRAFVADQPDLAYTLLDTQSGGNT